VCRKRIGPSFAVPALYRSRDGLADERPQDQAFRRSAASIHSIPSACRDCRAHRVGALADAEERFLSGLSTLLRVEVVNQTIVTMQS